MDYSLLFAQGTAKIVTPLILEAQQTDANNLTKDDFKGVFDAFGPIIVVMVAIVVVKALYDILGPKSKSKGYKSNRRRYGIDPDNSSTGYRAEYNKGKNQLKDDFDDAPVGDCSYCRKPIMTPTERDFFVKLCESAKSKYWVFTQVSLWAIAENREKSGENYVARKRVDFVLCNPRDASVILAIELDDWTHNKASVQRRDAQKDAILESAGIPLLRVQVGNTDAAMLAVRNKLLEIYRKA
ncbi:MAG: DUF2726 domain-containing protein [Thermoguttaceae bacterium]|nr:DUF2726 domain-containing protein [Thermoguttaceae bacterium]